VIESKRVGFGTASNTYWRDEKCMHKFNWEFGREEPLGLPKLKWEGELKSILKQ